MNFYIYEIIIKNVPTNKLNNKYWLILNIYLGPFWHCHEMKFTKEVIYLLLKSTLHAGKGLLYSKLFHALLKWQNLGENVYSVLDINVKICKIYVLYICNIYDM